MFIENVVVTGGAPYSLFVKGYPTPGTSYIEMTLRNISFSGLTQSPHYVIENVDSIELSEVYVQVWQEWNTTSDAPNVLGASTLVMVFMSIFSIIFVALH